MARKDKQAEHNNKPGDNRTAAAAPEKLSQMINASRAFRNLPPEFTMGKKYDGEE
ncbi:hypothetical protein [Desulfoscipio geothermicus]|uniref:Uncharacterized protein n=1 Tax=Desulfoscipio geothermicus DSM 3669 TaxID=1121426 RepID=A0A1I6CNJ8_9FIRM|nr:hypothetical protein [Desulfoscipio geothermicus]SFQ94757.1 hypothetical protein SAMN05660706_10149 [Desulfoscipio geothermicus DSM 3669]